MKIYVFSWKLNEKSLIFMISQGFGGNLGSISTTPQSSVRAYCGGPVPRAPRSHARAGLFALLALPLQFVASRKLRTMQEPLAKSSNYW